MALHTSPFCKQGTALGPSSLTQMISGLVGQLLMLEQPGQCHCVTSCSCYNAEWCFCGAHLCSQLN